MGIVILLVSVSALLYAVTNVVDKALIGRVITNPIALLVIGSIVYLVYGFSSLTVVPPLAVRHLWLPLLAALLVLGATLLYYRSLQRDEASRVVPLFGFITLFSVAFGALVFHETFTPLTYVGIALIVGGSWVLMTRQGVLSPFRSRALGLMLIASLLWSMRFVIDKHLLSHYPSATVVTYQLLFQGVFAACLLPLIWREIWATVRRVRSSVVIVWINEGIAIAALSLYVAGLSRWFFSLTSALASVQYLFLFLLTLVVNRFRPALIGETFTCRIVVQKFVATATIIGGIVFLSL